MGSSKSSFTTAGAVPFNVPYMTGRELDYITEAHAAGHLSGDGPFTKKCHTWLEEKTGAKKALLTTSCTTALEMAATLLNLDRGDEVIMPSYTFVTTANAFVRFGATPVFVDIRPDTLNIDETKIEAAITDKTRAIVPVHYAGVGCDMDAIMAIADRHGLMVIEDAAQGVLARYRGKGLGAIGHMGALSFHESKNIICGEGGALLLSDESLIKRAEIIWEKGTDRRDFYRGAVDKYTWRDVGSSCLPSDILAAFLYAQFEESAKITARRRTIREAYHERLQAVPTLSIPSECLPNAHLYCVMAPHPEQRASLITHLRKKGIEATFHYVPLHSSPGGKKFGRVSGDLSVTENRAARIVRLPLWLGMEDQVERIATETLAFFGK